jgi:hypothetical protein
VAQVVRTFIVECFLPGVDDAAVRRAADATAAEIRRLDFRGGHVQYLGALLMAVDEVVLHTFRASDLELVRLASVTAGLPFARIIESLEVTPDTPVPLLLHGGSGPS